MVGGLADWFAVTALFRHPLGIPIPHTALLPRNQAKAARNVGRFFEAHFLEPGKLEERLRSIEISRHASAWLAHPGNALALARQLTAVLGGIVRAEPSPRVIARARAWLRAGIADPGADAAIAEATARLIKAGTRSALVDEVLGLVRRAVDENRASAVALVSEQEPLVDREARRPPRRRRRRRWRPRPPRRASHHRLRPSPRLRGCRRQRDRHPRHQRQPDAGRRRGPRPPRPLGRDRGPRPPPRRHAARAPRRPPRHRPRRDREDARRCPRRHGPRPRSATPRPAPPSTRASRPRSPASSATSARPSPAMSRASSPRGSPTSSSPASRPSSAPTSSISASTAPSSAP